MFDSLLSPVAPHLCCGCNKTGTLLCEYCKYDIVNEEPDVCIICGGKYIGVCKGCTQIAQRGWHAATRTDTVRKLIDDYKFENARSAYKVLANLLHERLPSLPLETVVVPIPTIPSHIRQRGYDHAALLAKAFAKHRRLAYRPLLRRTSTSSQRGASKTQRLQQAQTAFRVPRPLNPNMPYLVVDDIVTTGATLTFAAKTLRVAGAKEVWVAAVARQPLD
jgi:ComF family protein